MYTIGYVSSQSGEMSNSIKLLLEKDWQIMPIQGETFSETKLPIECDAVIVKEETTVQTCNWMITLAKNSQIPIYILSNNEEKNANIIYLQLGAKACFSVNMQPEEFYYTLKNLLSQNQQISVIGEQKEEKLVNNFKLIFRNLSVLINGDKEVILTKKEFQVLELLSKNPEKAISYEEFQHELWPKTAADDCKHSQIANVICNLRKKIELDKDRPRFVKTIRSKGYMLNTK